jgi:endonuclease/exonuclease/phosphatase family metal-dependent hydrolase
VKVMTFNIWNYNRPWTARRRLIADLIGREQPDVVALQETRHDRRFERGKGQGEQLGELTGYHCTFAVGQVYVPVLRVDEGLTILTPGEPASVTVRRLTMHLKERDDHDQRICVAVSLEANGKRVHIFDTHFSLSPVARLDNALEVVQFVDETAGGEPAVVMGDLNAEPDSAPIRCLTGSEEIEGRSAAFLDCWVAIHPNEAGYTYASFDPVRRIDYVLARNIVRVREARLVGDASENGVFPSDHLGIVVELDV